MGAESWLQRVDAARGFSLSHPPDWRVQRGASALLLSIAAPQETEGFRSNLNVVRRVRDRSCDVDGLAQIAVREATRFLTDLVIIDIEPGVVAGMSSRRLLFAYRQGIFSLTTEQWVSLADDHAWIISAGASSSIYDSVADVFAAVVASLRVEDRHG